MKTKPVQRRGFIPAGQDTRQPPPRRASHLRQADAPAQFKIQNSSFNITPHDNPTKMSFPIPRSLGNFSIMKTLSHLLAFIMALLFFGQGMAQNPVTRIEPVYRPDTIHVWGFVKNANGKPMPHVKINVTAYYDRAQYEITTNALGRYDLKNIPEGRYSVWVDSAPYGENTERHFRFNADSSQQIDFRVNKQMIRHTDEPAIIAGFELKRLPFRDIQDRVTNIVRHDGETFLFGSRNGAFTLYIDGIKMRYPFRISPATIERMDVYEMFIPANFE